MKLGRGDRVFTGIMLGAGVILAILYGRDYFAESVNEIYVPAAQVQASNMERVRAGIQEALDGPRYVSELGFSFNYPNDMFVMRDPDAEHRIFIIPNSYKTSEGGSLTAVVISADLNDPPATPLEWLNGPNSGADMSDGYAKLTIDGQEAISLEGGAWIVVNTPDNGRQLSIATLPGKNPDDSLMAALGTIIDSLAFAR